MNKFGERFMVWDYSHPKGYLEIEICKLIPRDKESSIVEFTAWTFSSRTSHKRVAKLKNVEEKVWQFKFDGEMISFQMI